MSAMDAFWAAPPVTRTLTAATVLLSVTVWGGFLDPYYVVFILRDVFRWKIFTFRQFPRIWRIFTPFLLTGPKLGLILDPYFLYTYGSALETGAARFSQPGDFFTYLIFVCAVILVTCGVFLQGVLFLSPLTLALAYTYAQENPTRRLSYFIITFQAKYLPYAMLAMTFVMASPQAALTQATGLVAAHLYDFLTKVWPEYGGGRQLIKTPTIVRQWFQQPVGTGQTRAFGTAFQSRPAQSAPQRPAGGSRGWASGFSSGSWSGRGTGRRLGGE